MRRHQLFTVFGIAISCVLILSLVCGCGGGEGGSGSMMLKVAGPVGGSCSGNAVITATMLNPAMATSVNFRVNGNVFDTVTTPTNTMTARLDTLSLGLSNGPALITVVSTGNVYMASTTVNVNNPRSLYVAGATGHVGDYVAVTIKLNDFSNAAKCQFTLQWDDSKLQLDTSAISAGSGVPFASTLARSSSPGLMTVTISGTDQFVGSDILVAHFQIRTPSPVGSKNDISFSSASVSDSTDHVLTETGVAGSVVTN